MKIQNTPTMRRMPSYLHKLFQMRMDGKTSVSCTDLAQYMGIEPIVTRKDIAATGLKGHRGYGYMINELVDAILMYIGWDKKTSATLIGAGALGSALLGYSDFIDYNLRIESVFDSDPNKVGREIHGHVRRGHGERAHIPVGAHHGRGHHHIRRVIGHDAAVRLVLLAGVEDGLAAQALRLGIAAMIVHRGGTGRAAHGQLLVLQIQRLFAEGRRDDFCLPGR